MPVQTIFFVGDKLHSSQSAPSVHSVSSTANGYNRESVRDTSWYDAWKPSDGTGDEYIQIDGGSAGWLGTTVGDTIHVALAYDARGCNQTTISVQSDATDPADGVTGVTFLQGKAVFTVNATGPTVDYQTFTIPAGGKRHYRIAQYNSARGGGTKTIPIYAIAFFTASEVYIIDTEYLGNAPSEGDYSLGANVGVGGGLGGIEQMNVNGAPFQECDVNFDHATQSLRDALTSMFMTWHQGQARNIWLQYQNLYNPAKDSFAMGYFQQDSYRRPIKDLYDTRLRFRTAGKPI